MAKHKKKRRAGGSCKQRPATKSAERVEIRENPMKRQLELLNAMRPCLKQARAARKKRTCDTCKNQPRCDGYFSKKYKELGLKEPENLKKAECQLYQERSGEE